VLDNRADKLAGDLDEAQRLKARAEEAGAAYDKALADARTNAKDIALKNRDALNAESDKRRKVLETDLHAKLEASDAALRKRTAEAMGNVRGIAVDTAAAIVERLTGKAPDRATVEGALDRAPH
jgi:F-type H+-transporting ATPase subunit b